MIKFIHFADVHLGMENYGKIDKNTGLHSRMADFLKSFDVICDYSIREKVDFVLFAGDAYKTRDPSPTYQREFAKRIKRIASHNIAVVLLVGNHDLPNAVGKANTLDIYSTLAVDNVYVARKPELLKFKKTDNRWRLVTEGFSDFQIVALPWLLRTQLLSSDEYKKKDISKSYEALSDKMKKIIEDLAGQVDRKIPCVFLGHFSVAGAEYGSERKVYFGFDIVVPEDILRKGPWQYIALGHLHKYQVLSEDPPIIYSGSIERIDFGEEKEEKGFISGRLENRLDQTGYKANYQFIPLPARKFLTISCKIDNEDIDPTEKVLTEIKKHQIKGLVVKLNVKIPEEKLAFLDDKKIQTAFSEAYYFVGLQKDIVRKERKKNYENIEGLSVLETLEKYWQSKKLSKAKIEKLKPYLSRLLEKQREINN